MFDGEVLILCGGKGTRSYPFTQHFPKVMMPINGTPILVHVMRIYAAQGFTKFVLSVGYRKEVLYDYFDGRQQNWEIRLVDTGQDADTGDRILRCADYLAPTFFATYGDGLSDVNLGELLKMHHASGRLASLTTVPLRSQYGVVVVSPDGEITRFKEKPTIADHWINAGFFAFNKEVFEHWSGKNLEADVLPRLARNGQLNGYKHTGFWASMDTNKDQEELERLYENGQAPWMIQGLAPAV